MINTDSDIIIKDISLAGVNFISDSDYTKHIIYRLRLRPKLFPRSTGLVLKIVIIGKEQDSGGKYVYTAMYRGLSKAQVKELEAVITDYTPRVEFEAIIFTAGTNKIERDS